MKNEQGQDVTPVVGGDENFFDSFSLDDDSGLVENPDETSDDEGEANGDEAQGADDQQELEVGDDEGSYDDDGEGDDGADTGSDDDDSGSGSDEDGSGDGSYGSMMTEFVDNGLLEITDEDKDYTADEKGFSELVKDTVEARLEEAVGKKLSERNSQIVEIEEFLDNNPGATIEDFQNEQQDFDYTSVDESNPQHAVYLVEDFYRLQGYEESEIKETLAEMNNAKSIGRHAKKAKAALIKYQEQNMNTKREAREQRIKQEADNQLEENRKWEQKILKTDKIAGIEISPKERQVLADYILKPVEGGRSRLAIDEAENAQESALLYAYIRKNNLDLSKLQRKAETKATLRFKKGIDKHTDRMAKPNKSRAGGSTTAAANDLSGLDDWNMM